MSRPIQYQSRSGSYGGKSFAFDVARGTYEELKAVNKFGRTLNADSGVATDVWDGANATEDDDIWLAPTVARVHAITSNDAGDTAAGAGARTIRVYGLQSWDSKESSEVVILNGAGAVNTVNAYVIIHRIKVLTSGASGPNIGDIFATAAVDGTITAMIIAGEGQTQMAVYGIPSSQAMYLTQFYASALSASPQSVSVNISLQWTPDVKSQVGVFQVKHTLNIYEAGVGTVEHDYEPFNRFAGPGIMKLQVTTDKDNSDVSGGFDLILEDL